MRKILGVLLVAVSLPAFADWTLTETTADGGHLYYDPSTIVRTRDIVRVWQLTDLSALNQVGRLSYRTLHEFDCSAHRHRVIRSESFLTHMATGTAQDVDDRSKDEVEWDAYNPGSRFDKLEKLVCTK